jgi:hypothetical protein
VNTPCINRKTQNLNLRARSVKIFKYLLTRKWLIAESSILVRENLIQGRVNSQLFRAELCIHFACSQSSYNTIIIPRHPTRLGQQQQQLILQIRTTTTILEQKMCQAADSLQKMLPPGWFFSGFWSRFPPPQKSLSGLLVPPIRPGGLNQKVLPDQDEDWK